MASPPSSLDPGRLTPGTVVAGRYRVVGLIGRGGMGEVYRADDLKLGQPVALKFLPEELGRDPQLLERFLEEVRLARSIAHPGVCRVHDIGEMDGQHFLSMEFVDGEDLASLLRRIGRLPKEKALEIARRLCSALAAVHERGVVHRDLKPANVMLDGRGEVRLTDFGLAALSQRATGGGIAGTPQYMAPEQLRGQGASVRSDVYSLGLVLYELFTGRAVHGGKTVPELLEAHRSGVFEPPSSVLADIEPAVESAILRCLEKDPERRPASALAVAAALPGGDPLAAALAAGETPSPELVAAAGERGGLAPAKALALTALVLAGLVGVAFVRQAVALQNVAPIERPPEAMAERARALLDELGVPAEGDEHFGYRVEGRQLQYLERTAPGPDLWRRIAESEPSPVRFWYRRSPRRLAPQKPLQTHVTASDPSPLEPDQVLLELDSRGRLVELLRRPPEQAPMPAPGPEPAWSALLARAGFDVAALEPAEPTVPPGYAQHLAAWRTAGDAGAPPQLVSAGALGGAPLFLRVLAPWTSAEFAPEAGRVKWALFLTLGIFVAFLLAAIALAVRNLRAGRGDRRGALRLGTYVSSLMLVSWLLSSDLFATAPGISRVAVVLGTALLAGGVAWGLYLAVEPYVRRRWPQALIGWTRMLSGGWRDPRAARDVLVGMVGGLLLAVPIAHLFALAFDRDLPQPIPTEVSLLGRPLAAAGSVLAMHLTGLLNGLSTLLIAFLLRALLRNTWLAGIAFVGLLSVQSVALGLDAWLALMIATINAILFVLLLRFGLLMLVALFTTAALFNGFPIAPSEPLFYSGSGWAVLILLALAALHAGRAAMAGQKVFRKPLLEV